MSKSIIWNQLKAFDYDARQLKLDLGITYAQVTKEQLESILTSLEKEVGEGVNESLSSGCGGVTGNTVNQSEVVINQSEGNYIVVCSDYPQVIIKDDYTAKDLTEVTEDQLSDSLYTDKVTAELMFPGTYYQVLEINPNNIRQELTEYFNNKFEDIVTTEISDNVTEFKGIPVEHYETIDDAWHLMQSLTDYLVIELSKDEILVQEAISEDYTHSNVLESFTELKQYLGYSEVYRGIEFSHSTKHNYTCYVDLLPNEVQLTLGKASYIKRRNENNSITGFYTNEPITIAKQWLSTESEKIEQAIASNQVHQYAAVLGGQQKKQVFVSEPLPGSVVLSKPFNYDAELLKLKSLSRQEFLKLIGTIQHVKHFSSYYIPKWEVVETYFTKQEYELATKVEQAEKDNDCHWLKLLDIQDCFSEAGNYHYSQMQLIPKLYLFATMTEFVFLMECYLDLIGHFFNLSLSYAEISNEIYVSWCAITAICFNRYVRMPAIGSDNYSKLLNIWYQSA